MNLTSDSATNLRLRAFITGLVAPLAVLILTLKTLRILLRRELESFTEALPLYQSDILLLTLFTIAGSLLMCMIRSRSRNIRLAILQLVGVLWAGIEFIAHQFYLVTGSTIDFGIFLYSVQRLSDTSQVLSSEIPAPLFLLVTLTLLILLLLPWYILRKTEFSQVSHKMSRQSLLAVYGVGIALSAWSLLPADASGDPGFARSNLINFAFSMTRIDDNPDTTTVIRESLLGLTLSSVIERNPRKNLVLVILESTRASATSMYNPALDTTPFLNSLKEQSLFAERAYAVVPHTSKSLVAMLCGIEPHLTMTITEAGSAGIPSRCLPELLTEAGYQSVFFQSATKGFEAREGLVKNLGYKEFIPLEALDIQNLERANYFGIEDAVMLPRSRDWLAANGNSTPILATYLTSTPHHDYLAPRNRYGFRNFSDDEEFNRYLNSVRYVDEFSRELVEQYKELGYYQESLFVFIGDHGEAFNEHGRSQHDNVLWEEGLHIPWLIFDPSAPDGRTISAAVNQLDLLPTLLRLLGFDHEGADIPGEEIWNASADRTLYAHCWYELNCMASLRGQTKFIEHFDRRGNEFFDLSTDRDEAINLYPQLEQTAIDQLRIDLFTWRQSVNSLYNTEP